ncbi:MAG TPA: YciI family protein [Chryseosolibacter sp.]
MEKYMFLFRGGDVSHLSAQAQESHMGKWLAWVEKLTKQGRYVGGEPLLPGGKTIKGPKKTVTDGPFAETKEVIGGFFIVEAKDYDEAVQMAKDSPDYEYGGSVEVRTVQKLDMQG